MTQYTLIEQSRKLTVLLGCIAYISQYKLDLSVIFESFASASVWLQDSILHWLFEKFKASNKHTKKI